MYLLPPALTTTLPVTALMPSADALIFSRVRVPPLTMRSGLVRTFTSALALRTSIGSENVVPVAGPVKVSSCLPVLMVPLILNETALVP